jgi:hypothetical protein
MEVAADLVAALLTQQDRPLLEGREIPQQHHHHKVIAGGIQYLLLTMERLVGVVQAQLEQVRLEQIPAEQGVMAPPHLYLDHQ